MTRKCDVRVDFRAKFREAGLWRTAWFPGAPKMAVNMAFPQVPQRVALRDLEEMVLQNNWNQQMMMFVLLAARRREEEQARARRPRR